MRNEEEAIKQVLYNYQKTISSNDFEGWLSLWAEDAIEMPPNTSIKNGIDHLKGANKRLFSDLNLNMSILRFPAIKIFNDIGISVVEYSVTGETKSGEIVNLMEEGKALTVFKKQDDESWKIIFDCFNSNK